MIRRCIVGTLAAAALAVAGRAGAEEVETDNDHLRRGLAHYEQLEYEEAVGALEAALEVEGNDDEELEAIYRTLGILYVLADRADEGRSFLVRLFCVAPEFAFDQYTSPRIREVYAETREQWEIDGRPCPDEVPPPPASAAAEVRIEHRDPVEGREGAPLELSLVLADETEAASRAAALYRTAGEDAYQEVTAEPSWEGGLAATVPGRHVRPPALEYYLRAVDGNGSPVGSLGSAEAPLSVPVREASRGGVVRSWWLWTLVGVAVAGIATGVALGVVYGGGDDGPSADEPVTLTITLCDAEAGDCP